MTHNHSTTYDEKSIRREKAISRYIRALDQGNLDSISDILEIALDDPELDRMIAEVNQALLDEEELTPTATDAQFVRELLQKHFAGALDIKRGEDIPLTVGEVAARLQADRRIPVKDEQANRSLLGNPTTLPTRLKPQMIWALAAELRVQATEHFWRLFRDTAITLALGRSQANARLAAMREEQPRLKTPAQTEMPMLSKIERERRIEAAIRDVHNATGIGPVALRPGIVPLDDLIAAYPLRVMDVPDLTYRRASEFLAAEIGSPVTVPVGDSDRRLAGFLYLHEYSGTFYGCILVKHGDLVTRRRFSAAHELGHYILDCLPLLERRFNGTSSDAIVIAEGLSDPDEMESDLPTGQLTFGHSYGVQSRQLSGNLQQMEEMANQFAAVLLMPADACRQLVDQYRQRFGARDAILIRRLANEFLVSEQAMRRRLIDLGLIGGPTQQKGST